MSVLFSFLCNLGNSFPIALCKYKKSIYYFDDYIFIFWVTEFQC